MTIALVNLYESYMSWLVAYRLLQERDHTQNISHKKMPAWKEHISHINSKPHPAWYGIMVPGSSVPVGCIYLSHQREIGIGILKEHQRKGYAETAIKGVMDLHPGPFLANINPANEASIALFRKLGFGGPIQITLEKT